MTINNKEPSFSEEVGTSRCENMSNEIISDDYIFNSQQRQILDKVYNWFKIKCKYRSSLTKKRRKSTLPIFLCQEEQLCASLIVSILFFRNVQELLTFILANRKS